MGLVALRPLPDEMLTLSAQPSALEMRGEAVTADHFRVLGLHPLVGRTFAAADEGQRNGPAIAILNHGFWMRQFGGDRTILNRTIRLNNVPFAVVGVLAPGYSGIFTWSRPDVFVPVAMGDRLRPPRRPSPRSRPSAFWHASSPLVGRPGSIRR